MRNYLVKGILLLFFIFSTVLNSQSQSPVPCSSGTLFNADLTDFITIPNSTAINTRSVTDRTFEFWFKTADVTTRQVMFEEGGGSRAFIIYIDGGKIYLGAYQNNTTKIRFFRKPIQADTWYHVAFSLEESPLEFRWYLNGELQDVQTGFTVGSHNGEISLARNGSQLKFPTTSATWTLSSESVSGSETSVSELENKTNLYNFTGNIALFRIWNVARAQGQINTNKSVLLTTGSELAAYLDKDTIYFQAATDDTTFSTVSLNGKIAYFTIPDTDAINLQNVSNRTIEFRFKADDMTTRQVLYEEGGNTNAFVIFIEAERLYLGAYRDQAIDNPMKLPVDRRFFRSGDGQVVEDQWYHVALTLSGGNTLKWFLDGVEQDSKPGLIVDRHTSNISIGRKGDDLQFPDTSTGWTPSGSGPQTSDSELVNDPSEDPDYVFSGDITLFRIWNVAREQVDIDANKSTLISVFIDGQLPNLVAIQEDAAVYFQSDDASPAEIDEVVGAETTNEGVQYTWSGAGSSNWTEATNWVADVAPTPSRTQNITIQDIGTDPILTSAINVGSLTIESGVDLVINSGATLNVYYNFENNGTVTVQDGGSLIYHNCDSAITGTGGIFNVEKNTPVYTGSDFYSYWSSPVVPAAANIGTVFPDAEIVYSYDASSNPANWSFEGAGVGMNAGVGYAIQNEGTGGQLRSFSGAINQGVVPVTTYYNPNFDGEDTEGNTWSVSGDNLVGNPYASAIDWDKVIADEDNSEIEGTIYYWNQSSSEVGYNTVTDYLQYNSTGGADVGVTGNIASGQAFFIKMTNPATSGAADNQATITFKPTHQINGVNTVFYRGKAAKDKGTKDSKKQNRSWFTFTRGSQVNTLLVGFLEDATNQFDRLYDAPFDTDEASLAFYSLVKKKYKASIQGLPLLKRDKKVVKLGFTVDQIGEHTIAIQDEHIDPEYYIYLRDREQKVTVDLRQRSYTFSIDSIGENNTRFKLIYTKKKRKATTSSKEENPIVTEIDSKDFSVYVDEVKDLIIEYDYDQDNIKEASLYTIRGQRIQRFDGNLNLNVAGLKTGIYLVEATLLDGRKRIKKLVIAK